MSNSILDRESSGSDDKAALRAMFPYRRRPLLSNTYCTLVQIYSHFGNHSLCCESGRPCPTALGLGEDSKGRNFIQGHIFRNLDINQSVPEASTTPDTERGRFAKANEETCCGKLPGIYDTKGETSTVHHESIAGKDGENGHKLVDKPRVSTNEAYQTDGVEAKGKMLFAGSELSQGLSNATNDREGLLSMERLLMDDSENQGGLAASFSDTDDLNYFLNHDQISDFVKSTGEGASRTDRVCRRESFGKCMKVEKSFPKHSVVSHSYAMSDGRLEEKEANESAASREANEDDGTMVFEDKHNEEVVLLKRREEDTLREPHLISGYMHANTGNHIRKPQHLERVCYTREALLQLKEGVTLSESILKMKRVFEAELHGTVGNNSEPDAGHQDCTSKRKRRGPISEEKKAKKKKKQRKKRAEKNRKLGVNRLKIQPILKQKPVQHCRHYLNGRCHEGEKCKFSHDVIPLTKSQACCHFVRQACMKGDECPFDHDLSKYPCNNYVTLGFCSRGDSCLFSHKKPPNDDSGLSTKKNKTEPKSLTHVDRLASTKQLVDDLLSSSRTHPPKGKLAIDSPSQPAPAPKGFSFLSFDSSPSDNAARQSQKSCGVGSGVNQGAKIPNLAETSEEANLLTSIAPKALGAGVSLLDDFTGKLKHAGLSQLSNRGCGAQPKHDLLNINTSNIFSFGANGSMLDDSSSKMKHVGSQKGDRRPNPNAPNIGPTKILSSASSDLHVDSSAIAKQSGLSQGSDDIARVGALPKQCAFSRLPSLSGMGKRTLEELPAQGADTNKRQAVSSHKISTGGQPKQVASFAYPALSGGLEHHTLRSCGETSLSASGSGDYGIMPATLNLCNIFTRAKESASEAQKTNKKMQDQIASPAPFGQVSKQVSDQYVDDRTTSAETALRSTLAFAEKYGSGIKLREPTSAPAVGTQVNIDGGNTSVSGLKQKPATKAADILNILYSSKSK